MKNKPKREVLALELESVADGQGRDLSELIAKVRNDDYPDSDLVRDLMVNKLRFFATKLILKHYDTETI